jgi:hypothetical protein
VCTTIVAVSLDFFAAAITIVDPILRPETTPLGRHRCDGGISALPGYCRSGLCRRQRELLLLVDANVHRTLIK